jgi:hypothetical protein
MNDKTEQIRQMTRYLMAEMSEEERSEFEDRFLEDSDLFEALIAAEDEMMRAYVRGGGSEAERAAFARRFLATPEGRQRVALARSLMNYVSSRPPASIGQGVATPSDAGTTEPSSVDHGDRKPQRRPWFAAIARAVARPAPWAAAALVLFIAGGVWSAVRALRLRAEFEQAQAQLASGLRRERELRDQVADLNTQLQQQAQKIEHLSSLGATILLFSPEFRLVRHSGPQRPLVISPGFSAVLLQPVLQTSKHASYGALLETAEGRPVWRQTGLKSWPIPGGAHGLGLIVPAEIFESRNYVLKVSGRKADGTMEEVDSYAFRVIKSGTMKGKNKLALPASR